MKSIVLYSLVLFLMSGCSSIIPDANRSKFGAEKVFDQPIEKIDLISLLTKGGDSGEALKGESFSKAFDKALSEYNPQSKLERNRIQDRIIMASNNSCEIYKVVLKEKQSKANFWWGAAATTFGAAGAVVKGAEAGHTLAALSGTSSGIRAEYNQSYYSDLAAQVITKGINARRSKILEVIAQGKDKELDIYTVEMAIADAISYHGACSLIGGLEQADAAVTKMNQNAGIDALGANAFFKEIKKEQNVSPENPPAEDPATP